MAPWMGRAKSTMVVVPPKAAARLAASGDWVSTPGLPVHSWGTGVATWAWGSMPPGTTIFPEASMTRAASGPSTPGSVTATIFSPCTATSITATLWPVTT